jgi:DNA-binding NarL/FixJ family response regulator
MTVRLLIADDHTIVRGGIRMFLGLDDEIDIVGETADGQEAVTMAHTLKPDVVLMDLIMPGMDGIAATAVIRRELPEVEVVALTSVLEDSLVVGAIRAGAIGYLLKDTQADELCQAIKAAANGQVYLSGAAASRLLREVKEPDNPQPLTDREMDVLRLISKGLANKEIARELGIGQQTVKTYVSAILGKLGVQSRTQAALFGVQSGLVTVSELSAT